MKRLYIVALCFILSLFSRHIEAADRFPAFDVYQVRLYIPIETIVEVYQEDLEHEVGFNFSYNIVGQLFPDSGDGHIQKVSEGFSGTTDKSTPWKTLTELLAAYQRRDAAAVKALYTPESLPFIEKLLSDPEVNARFTVYMESIKEMEVLLGFEHKGGFLALTNIDFGDSPESGLTYFHLKQVGSEYLLNSTTLNEPITFNLSRFLQLGNKLKDLPAPKHGLSIEKIGTGDGTVIGSGIDCGEDCLEVYVEGTAVWLQATPDEYSTFEDWMVNGEPLKGQLSIKEDTIVTAVFEKIPPKEYTLTIETAGTGAGVVSDSETECEAADCLEFSTLYADEAEAPFVESGIDCGETCNVTYTEGTTIRLKAVAMEGSEFVEWLVNGEPLVANPEITDDVTMTAVFDAITSPEEEQPEAPQTEESQQP